MFETWLPDHHKLIQTVIKSGSFRGPPRKKVYTSYRNFDVDFFNEALQEKLSHLENDACSTFDSC